MKQDYTAAIKQIGHVTDLWLPLRIQYAKTPGMAVGIVYKGKLVYKKGFGFADAAQKERVDEKTLFHIASISKTFTSVAIMQLVEAKKLRLDDYVADHLKWFAAKGKRADAAHITIRQLLAHIGGIFRDGDTPHWETGEFPVDLQKSFSAGSLTNENLSSFKYSNYGYAVLGAIIAKVSGLSYEEYVSAHILKPLGLQHTYPDYQKDISHLATGFGREIPNEKREKFPHYKTNAYASATGFISNVEDLAKYVQIFSLTNNKGSLLQLHSKREMMYPQGDSSGSEKYGLGLDVLAIQGNKVVGHSGGFQGFLTNMVYDPHNDIGVIVLSNALGSPAYQISLGILESIYRATDKIYSSRKKAAYEKLEGIYRNIWGDRVVAQVGGTLIDFSSYSNNPLKDKRTLIPLKETSTFILENKDVFDSAGEVGKFLEFKNGKAQKFLQGATAAKRVAE